MKKLSVVLAGIGIVIGLSAQAQTQDPDQNPNYRISAEKYAAQSDDLLKNQGETVQDTYTAFDWTTYKAEKRQARIDRRHELRMERARYSPNWGDYYGGYGFYNRPYVNGCNALLWGAGLHYLLY